MLVIHYNLNRKTRRISNKSLAAEVINKSTLARWLRTVPPKEIQTFVNDPIPIIGMMKMLVESKGWRNEDAEFVVASDGLKLIIGRDVFEALGISITQTLNSVEDEETVTQIELEPWDHWGNYRSDKVLERNMYKAPQ